MTEKSNRISKELKVYPTPSFEGDFAWMNAFRPMMEMGEPAPVFKEALVWRSEKAGSGLNQDGQIQNSKENL